jgi:hypothetical protein
MAPDTIAGLSYSVVTDKSWQPLYMPHSFCSNLACRVSAPLLRYEYDLVNRPPEICVDVSFGCLGEWRRDMHGVGADKMLKKKGSENGTG